MPYEFSQLDGHDTIVLRFGYGDLVPFAYDYGVMGFITLDPPVNVGDTVKIGKKAMIAPIAMIFDKVESIDIVMLKLSQIKEEMEWVILENEE